VSKLLRLRRLARHRRRGARREHVAGDIRRRRRIVVARYGARHCLVAGDDLETGMVWYGMVEFNVSLNTV